MRIEVVHGQVMVTLPETILVLTKEEFIEALKRGKAWRRRRQHTGEHSMDQVMAERQKNLRRESLPPPLAAGLGRQRVWPGTGPLPSAPPAGLGRWGNR